MHEIKISADLAAIVLDTAKHEKLTEVTRVNVSFGQMIQIVPDIFKFAFKEAVRDTIAENTEINIEIIPVRLKCKKCNSEFGIEKNFFVCGKCGSDDLLMINGKELFVKSIEGE